MCEIAIISTPKFIEEISKDLSDEQQAELEEYVAHNPDAGKLIPGSGGLRKLRWSLRGRGKRGGLRVIYYYRVADLIFFIHCYRKSERDDMTADELKTLKKLLEDL
jgi:hypothetical protein